MNSPTPQASRTATVCLVILTTIAVAGALFWLRPVMIPFVLAVFVTLGLSAAVNFLEARLRVPGPLALPATLALGLVTFGAISTLVSASVGQLIGSAPAYTQQLAGLVDQALERLPLDRLGWVPESEIQRLAALPVAAARTLLSGTTNAILDLFSNSLLVLIFVVFLMLGASHGRRPTGTWQEIESRIQGYLLLKGVISAVTGLLVGVVLAVLGVPFALGFGLFAFLLNFIPNIGSVLATLLPVPVVLMDPSLSAGAAALAIGVPALIQIGVGNFLEPKLMGDSLDLHPVVILMMLIFWGMLWGVAGMLLATPITATIKILFEKLPSTRPLAELMAGRIESLRSPELEADA